MTQEAVLPGQRPSRAILSIAGSDPSGGAGIQADLKTFTAIGVYGGAVITCLTAQNSVGVAACLPIAPEFVKQQIQLVLADLPVSHIKTGMLGTDAIAGAMAEALHNFSGEIICDPVLRASDGHDLFQKSADNTGLLALLNTATVLTPNLPELATLTGRHLETVQEALAAATGLLSQYPKLRAIALTGGHIREQDAEVEDFLILRQETGPEIFSVNHARITTVNTHGTGCTFASAFAAYHLLLGNDQEAFCKTVSFLDTLLRQSANLTLGQGKGPLAHHLFRGKS
ncbi:bifunctional hydroxymethylpyrimidine kinase/phosphomethylpyrimidine kinase [Thiovibrio frasassiensis]|uniref:hydroxymethylpyrimidine kinase n=1 Tax=Thiovibrio frasassiensis TaxID=2984131 RepID=A0A9X4MHT5_9BACT|nr:bifunctional hydroxymethylpyrimidine kinase/phosphomethylpyrimidine kinase [Thiovibrio frasassiensis]MDG4476110.1 bifunctional hydroxymethylpyrimidine kinase/phosphomethylpyrimidine kinase [Thiovibrio frasassiensis]